MSHVFLGKWISAKMSLEDRFAPIFKKEITLEKEIVKAEIFISGLGFYELKINGELPDDTVLNPAHTQYSQTVFYRAFDVTDKLISGKNEITCEIGNGFFNEPTGVWQWQTASWRSIPVMIADIVITYADGTTEAVPSDESWLVTLDGTTRANSIYLGETYDAGCTELSWANAELAKAPDGELKEQYMPPIRRIESFSPADIKRLDDGCFIVTAPEMMTGNARIRIDMPEGTAVKITYCESLLPDGHAVKIGKGEGRDGNWYPHGIIQQDCFISAGKPFEFEPKFSYKGFKYIEIDGVDSLSEDDITLFRIANDVKIISDFTCSDEMLNRLHHIMRITLLNNFQGKPTDTPVWEKNGWLGDANCALTSMMYNFDMSTYLASFIDIIADCFRDFGSVPVIVPCANWSPENSPVWNSVFVFGVQAIMDYCGDTEYAKKVYPLLKAYAQSNIEQMKSLGWVWGVNGLSDWLAPADSVDTEPVTEPSEGAEICVTAFVYAMLRSMSYIAEKLDKIRDASDYNVACAHIYEAFNKKFLNKEKNIYETDYWRDIGKRTKYRQTSNLLPLAFGLCPENHKKAVAKNLAEDFIAKNYHLDTGCTGTRFVLPVLCDYGYQDIAMKVLLQKTYPSWGFWLEKGADSAWESWESATRSKNHYFLATYDEFFYTHIAGIRNVRDGYRALTVAPAVDCGLEFARLSLKTPAGLVRCEWEITESGTRVEIEIPENSEATVIIGDMKTVQSGGIKTYNV